MSWFQILVTYQPEGNRIGKDEGREKVLEREGFLPNPEWIDFSEQNYVSPGCSTQGIYLAGRKNVFKIRIYL